ncbi:dihydrofolate reductase family protein [Thermomonospora cellulosilytica]|uniref:Dihydrofolate reductase n=1 Tax=Thermomonospora cellulosilytica TaxID=1411118 RepID=A0A7W3R6Z5_9ACTN|nr:dihydrofolate reductase family protein [Thermomonospora cellulosilytica]MBA9002132.1 dihydrofolate reductase [Thermomonospora cellulosilytica]
MGKVVVDISMSLDGFVAAAGRTPDEPLGTGGERLHEWAFGQDERSRALLEEAVGDLGAVITGRTTYDDSVRWWGADGPSGPARRPVFVLTHRQPEDVPEGGVYTFVTGGVEDALRQAQAVAGDRTVSVMGGANVIQQYLAAGLVDEISLHLVPVLLGDGLRLFEHLGRQVSLERIDVVDAPAALHTRHRIKA